MAKDSVCEVMVFVKSAGLSVCVRSVCFAIWIFFKLPHKLNATLVTDNNDFYAETLLEYLKSSARTDERRIVVSLCHSGPNWSIVLDFNLSPVLLSPNITQLRALPSAGLESNYGWRVGGGTLPLDKHSLDVVCNLTLAAFWRFVVREVIHSQHKGSGGRFLEAEWLFHTSLCFNL